MLKVICISILFIISTFSTPPIFALSMAALWLNKKSIYHYIEIEINFMKSEIKSMLKSTTKIIRNLPGAIREFLHSIFDNRLFGLIILIFLVSVGVLIFSRNLSGDKFQEMADKFFDYIVATGVLVGSLWVGVGASFGVDQKKEITKKFKADFFLKLFDLRKETKILLNSSFGPDENFKKFSEIFLLKMGKEIGEPQKKMIRARLQSGKIDFEIFKVTLINSCNYYCEKNKNATADFPVKKQIENLNEMAFFINEILNNFIAEQNNKEEKVVENLLLLREVDGLEILAIMWTASKTCVQGLFLISMFTFGGILKPYIIPEKSKNKEVQPTFQILSPYLPTIVECTPIIFSSFQKNNDMIQPPTESGNYVCRQKSVSK